LSGHIKFLTDFRDPRILTCSHKYGIISMMKTTLEIPDRVFRRAKAKAAEKGIPFRQFVTDAVEDKLKDSRSVGQKPWMKHVGKLKRLRRETLQVDRVIEEAFEQIDPEMWGTGRED
jgi:hypothetical protein